MSNRRQVITHAALAPAALLAQQVAQAQAASAPDAAAPQPRLWAVEIRTGPAWVAARPAHEQQHFREHSANLKKLRDQGALALGARYGDKGLVIVAAESQAAARALMEQDPSVQAGVFAVQVEEFAVFYGGCVQPRRRS